MSLAATALQLIERFGESVTLTPPPVTPAFNPVTGAAQTAEPAEPIVGDGVPTRYKAHEVDGAVILAEDVRLLLGVNGSVPAVGWTVELGGDVHRVMSVQRIRQSGENVLLIVQLRRN